MDTSAPKPPAAPPRVPKLPVMPGVKLVLASTPFQQVLDWDAAGERVAFAHENDDFKVLGDAELKQLSSFTQTVYGAMAAQHAVHDDEVNEKAARIVVTGQYAGAAEQRANPTGRKDLEIGGFRPDQLENAYARGFRPAKPGEITKGAIQKEGHYEMVKASDGTTEQIWMVKDKETYWADERAKDKEVLAHTEALAGETKEKIEQLGFKATAI